MRDTLTSSRSQDAVTTALKVPPHSIEAEQAVLGGLMLDNEKFDQVIELLAVSDFYQSRHRLLFNAMLQMADLQQPFDVVTLIETLRRNNRLEEAGGTAYLATLARDTPSAANVAAYARIVRERSVLRQLIRVASEIADSAYNPEGRDATTLLEQAEQNVFAIAEQTRAANSEHFVAINDLLGRTLERIDELFQRKSNITGLPTGWTDFDNMTAGLQQGDLVIVAGRPSMGKTTLVMNIAEYVAIQERRPVAIFSMEMSGEQLVMRMISSLGHIDQQRLRTGNLHNDDWPRLTSAVTMLSEVPLRIDESSAMTPSEIRSRARRLQRECGQLGLIVIDYLQLMSTGGRNENRATEMAEISRSLKAMARELDVPVIALSQLSRKVEDRSDKRPVMSDLRESGAIEQDADLIAFIYRDEVYNEDSPEKGVAEIIIGKQRNGPIGTVRLTFLGSYLRFENFAPQQDL